MAIQEINQPVKVIDNGIRSFIPPCFCFELRDRSNSLVATVSQVALEVEGHPRLKDFEVVDLFRQNELWALGTISEYDAGPQARETGRRFTIRQLVR
ncbi:MAG TPA: hypothetical protein VKV37_12600 [Ktedonobacteraceae bacterium]|jgi:hypothetical protein|nr:hypothetical protein [Ktedonobacteraceae bacterium]